MKIKPANVTNIRITLDGADTLSNGRKSDAFGRNTPAISHTGELLDSYYSKL